MKHVLLFATAAAALSLSAFASSEVLLEPSQLKARAGGDNLVYIRQLESIETESHSSLGFRAGMTSLKRLEFGNGASRFAYGDATATTLAFHWESTPVRAAGHWGVYSGAGFATYGASMRRGQQGVALAANAPEIPARVNLLPLNGGLIYLADFHPATRWLMPVASLGVDYTLYLQNGTDGGDQLNARGGIWALRKSAGLRHSLEWLGLGGAQLSADYIVTSGLSGSGDAEASSSRLEGSALLFGLISNI